MQDAMPVVHVNEASAIVFDFSSRVEKWFWPWLMSFLVLITAMALWYRRRHASM